MIQPQTFANWARKELTKDGQWKCPTGLALRCAKKSFRANDQALRVRRHVLKGHTPLPARGIRRWNDRVQANWAKLQAKLGLPV